MSPENLDRLQAALLENWPYARWARTRLVVALSGGPDSVALLRLLLHIDQRHQSLQSESSDSANPTNRSQSNHPTIFAAHFDHRTRNGDSRMDFEFVQSLCRQLNIKLLRGRANIDNSEASESTLREQRYRFLEESAIQLQARYIVTGHHENDQVETVLFRLLRGTGLSGLAGIPPFRQLAHGITLVRPLLRVPRSDLLSALSAWDQPYVDDPSNLDIGYHRNLIRHHWLPELESHFENKVAPSLLRLSEQAREWNEWVDSICAPIVSEILKKKRAENYLVFPTRLLHGQHPLVIKSCLRWIWREQGWKQQGMSHDWWCRLADTIATPESHHVLNLPGDIRAEITRDQCIFDGSTRPLAN